MTAEETRAAAEERKAAKIRAEIEAENAENAKSGDTEQPAVAAPLYANIKEALNRLTPHRIYFDGNAKMGDAIELLLIGVSRSGVSVVSEPNGNQKEVSGLNAPLATGGLEWLSGPVPAGFKVPMMGTTIGSDPTEPMFTKEEVVCETLAGHIDVTIPLPRDGKKRPSLTIQTA